jgi:hypothetical protein
LVEEVKAWAMAMGVSEKAAQLLVDDELTGVAVLEMTKLPEPQMYAKLVARPSPCPVVRPSYSPRPSSTLACFHIFIRPELCIA